MNDLRFDHDFKYNSFNRQNNQQFQSGRASVEPWINPNLMHEHFEYHNMNNKSENFFVPERGVNMSQERSRSRERRPNFNSSFYGENKKVNDAKVWRKQTWARRRRSSSVPWSNYVNDNESSNLNKWNNNRFNPSRIRRTSYKSENSDYEDTDVQPNFNNNKHRNRDDCSSEMPTVNRFKAIFGNSRNQQQQYHDQNPYTRSSNRIKFIPNKSDNDQNRIVRVVQNLDISKNDNCESNLAKDCLMIEKKQAETVDMTKNLPEQVDFSKYYGESLTKLLNNNAPDSTDLKITVPIVNWSKGECELTNLQSYDSNCQVGGDGISVELFYLCKYCEMFTDGSQLDLHLRSKYHYSKYAEFLKTRNIQSDSTSSSSTTCSSECRSATEVQSGKQNEVSRMDMDDPNNILYRVHEELDFSED